MDEDALPQEFRMEVDRRSDGGTVRLYGELDLVHADDLEIALVELAASGGATTADPARPPAPEADGRGRAERVRTVVADLTNLEFLDSTGLSALLVARHRVALLGARLDIHGASGAARRVFEAAGLEDVLDD
jgi:ABC-type transporter Mla MlaB component